MALYQEVSPLFWLAPVAVAPMLMMALGLGWILASLNVFLEDTREIARLIIAQFLFFLTPIIYPVSKAAELAEGGSMWLVRAAGWFIEQKDQVIANFDKTAEFKFSSFSSCPEADSHHAIAFEGWGAATYPLDPAVCARI